MHARSILAVFCLSLLPSCGRTERIRECRQLDTLINGSLEKIELRHQQGTLNGDTYRDVAGGFVELADNLGKYKPQTEDLARSVDDYRSLAMGAAQVADRAATSLEIGTTGTWSDVKVELAKLRQQQKTINRQIEQTCRAH